jgi:hypothetical protein
MEDELLVPSNTEKKNVIQDCYRNWIETYILPGNCFWNFFLPPRDSYQSSSVNTIKSRRNTSYHTSRCGNCYNELMTTNSKLITKLCE